MRTKVVDGLLTLFYDGSKELWNQGHLIEKSIVWNRLENKELTEEEKMKQLSPECRKYWSWEQVIVQEGITVIPQRTFLECKNLERVIFADTVTVIKEYAFLRCKKLAYIKLSVNLEFIEEYAFGYCNLSSVFV
ncbi:leucine-rich repeat domain-containing protein [Chaetoceros tenuissimus]|uniref:Leucine-rich repeat domain-containing protein n=1 Tax=Chaetoceros tenuissimus TaxID=426638 RepID=A0AAD3D9S1_9STRA|nr:leucine-rich repeat domain-containing protein [Chaetoceros tenuissimus]